MSMVMYSIWLRSILAAVILIMLPFAAHAENNRVAELEQKLQERDKVIIELLERVKTLEQHIGISRPAVSVSKSNKKSRETAIQAATVDNAGAKGTLAPGAVVVDEAAAERALERSLTNEGALLLPSGFVEVEPSLIFSRDEDSSVYLFSSGGNIFAGKTERNSNTLTADLGLRMGLPWDSQLEVGIPYRWKEVEFVDTASFSPVNSFDQSGSALGDLRIGFATTLLREGLWQPDLVARITWDTATGDIFDNGVSLGGGFHEIRGSLTAIKRQDPIAFVGGLSYEHSFEESQIQPGSVISANFGSFIALSPETSLRFTFTGAYQNETELSGTEISGSDQTLASFVVGASTLLAPGTLLNVSAGMGLTDDSDDFTLLVSLPVRFDKPLY